MKKIKSEGWGHNFRKIHEQTKQKTEVQVQRFTTNV